MIVKITSIIRPVGPSLLILWESSTLTLDYSFGGFFNAELGLPEATGCF